jgi:hypothetical protein
MQKAAQQRGFFVGNPTIVIPGAPAGRASAA